MRKVELSAAVVTDDDFKGLHAAMIERNGISGRIQDIPATTIAGHRAKATVAVALFEENRDEAADADVAFAYAALRDIAGSAAA